MASLYSAGEEIMSDKRLRVFLCHSSDDKPAIRDLYQRLCAEGFDPWLDEEKILPGQDWHQEIVKAVLTSDVVLVCLSRSSISKAGYVQKEIKYALDVADEQPEGAIFLIPVKLEECEVPDRLSRWQWVDLSSERGYERLILALRARADALDLTTAAVERLSTAMRREDAQARPTIVESQVGEWQGVYIGMPADDVLRIHPREEATAEPEVIDRDSEGLVVRWSYPGAYLILARQWGECPQDVGLPRCYCYRVIEIYLA